MAFLVSASKKGGISGPSATNSKRESSNVTALFQDEDVVGAVVTRSLFDQLKKESLDEAISDAGSDDDEVVVADDADGTRGEQGDSVTELDELTLLMADTPMRKLRRREKDAEKAFQVSDLWASLKLRQEALALAKLYGHTGPYASENKFPMLLCDTHYKLAKTYAALQCIPQATDHCNRALEAMPLHGLSNEKVIAFKLEVNLLLGETLVMAAPPKPQAALQYFCAAEGCNSSEDIKDSGTRVMAAQCYALIGMSKLQEANATRNAEEELRQRADVMAAKLADLEAKPSEYSRLLQRLDETRNELQEETGFKSILLDEARSQLDKASDMLMCVIDEEEQRLRQKVSDVDRKQHPLIQALWRRACEFLFKMSLLEALDGNAKAQLGHLENITGIEEGYGCLSAGLLANTFKEKGAALVAIALMQEDVPQKNADLKRALATYDSLLELQIHRYPDDSAKQATARAETLKLIGNVYVALKHWYRAQEHFKEAQHIYASFLGPANNLVSDLESRILEVESYVEEDV